MNVWVDGQVFEGTAIDLSGQERTAEEVAQAVRAGVNGDGPLDGSIDGTGDVAVYVSCDDPGPAYEYVDVLRPGMALPLYAALAAAARSRGHSTPELDEADVLRSEASSIDIEHIDLREARKRVANAGREEETLRERASELKGQIDLLDERDESADAERRELRETISQLSDVETDRIAAEQALEQGRERARSVRTERERVLQMRDRATNLERVARERLATELYDEFSDALDTVPGEADAGDCPSEYDGDELTAALAVARLASIETPLVLACDRFDSASAAAETLDCPIIAL